MRLTLSSLVGIAISLPLFTNAQVTLAPLTTFGGDGWLAPGESTYLGTVNLERGLGYGNGHVYLVSRTTANTIRILNPTTGADLGGLNMTGVTGGSGAVISAMGVGQDGAIYAANLTTGSGTSPFKVYRWANEGSTPTVAYTGTAGISGVRVGDSLAVFGSGSSTRIAAGYGNSPTVAGNNGYAIIDPSLSTATAVGFGTPPNAGDFRLGIAFSASDRVWGTAGTTWRHTSFNEATASGSLLNSFNPASGSERLMSFTQLAGLTLMAVQSTGDSHVSLYDVSNPASPVYLLQGNNTSGTLTANGNGTGQVAWGDIIGNPDGTVSQTLYALSSNQGIQAFVVTVPEPGTGSLLLLGLGAFLLRRRAQR